MSIPIDASCQYCLTERAVEYDESSTDCNEKVTRNITGPKPDYSGLVSIWLCEDHFQKVSEWIREVEEMKNKT